MSDPNTQAAGSTATAQAEASPLEQLLSKAEGKLSSVFGAEGEEYNPIREALTAFGREVTKGYSVSGDLLKDLQKRLAEIDDLMAKQVNLIIHNAEFQKLEGAWRGLNLLLSKKPDNPAIKIQVLNMSKQDVGSLLERFDNASGELGWDRSPIHRLIYERRFDTPGAHPFGCMVGDYEFSHLPGDVNLLRCMARSCGAAHVPFISAASPKILGIKSWTQLPDPASLQGKMSNPAYVKWEALRKQEDSRYLAMTLPRVLARAPYGAETGNPVKAFNFEEDLRPPEGTSSEDPMDHSAYCWTNAAYAMAANTMIAWHKYGFCTEIRGVESGGLIGNLPTHTFTTADGSIEQKCPTEVAISQGRESELSSLGFMPLSHYVGTDQAIFYGAQTVQKPATYNKASATENAALSARLPYIFMVSRFAHYLKKMLYDKVGTKLDRKGLEDYLKEWIGDYCCEPGSGEALMAEKPLADALIEVAEIPGKPGYFDVKARLKPHIQLEGVDVKLGVVSKTGAK